ncbi:MAG TPA: hypothetical protein VKH81_11975 [Candidatus Angelobacter sp.]|nr:hypothetical protein [Candidatus Angelobacter sp.]
MAESSEAITGKFDFYDVLGYLVPGLALLGLVILPFGLIRGTWPPTSLTSAVFFLVGAHILGHILQGLLRTWEIVPLIRDKKGKMRSPSAVLLDDDHQSLAPIRTKIGELTHKFWGIPGKEGSAVKSWTKTSDADRDAAFLQARNLLLQSKKQSYFEQFQGKYALMGGMAASLLVAALYYAGWALGLTSSQEERGLDRLQYILLPCFFVFVLYLVILHVLDWKMNEKWTRGLHLGLLLALGLGTFAGGFSVANSPQHPEAQKPPETRKEPSAPCSVCCIANSENSKESEVTPVLRIEHKTPFMLILALAALAASVRCYGAYKAFAKEFAAGVWRDFANYESLG